VTSRGSADFIITIAPISVVDEFCGNAGGRSTSSSARARRRRSSGPCDRTCWTTSEHRGSPAFCQHHHNGLLPSSRHHHDRQLSSCRPCNHRRHGMTSGRPPVPRTRVKNGYFFIFLPTQKFSLVTVIHYYYLLGCLASNAECEFIDRFYKVVVDGFV